jgi:polysaccharide biosynthesis/export protein
MPNDRLVVYRDPIVRTTIFIDRLAAPFQTVLNSILQYSFTARSVQSIGTPIFGGGTNGNTTTTTGPAAQPGSR